MIPAGTFMGVPVYISPHAKLDTVYFYEVDLNKIPECGVFMFDGTCKDCPCKDKPTCKCPRGVK